jgi:cytochrome b6-f complex iron-sulfur subunit
MPTRRQFVQRTGTAAVAAAVAACGGGDGATGPGGGGNGGGNCNPAPGDVTIPLPAVGQTVNISGVGLGCQGVAVTRQSDTSVVAVSRQCTHQQCTVGLPPGPGQNMTCPCHGSVFTTSGSVVNGPATASLRSYASRIEGSNVVVTVS